MMGLSSIEWCDFTFNPWIGCEKVSSGCDFCYAEEAQDHRYHRVKWGGGPGSTRYRTKQGTWKNPAKWDKDARLDRVRRKVFCASLSDVFEDRAELKPWRVDLFEEIYKRQHLDWLMLTKRPENVLAMINESIPVAGKSDAAFRKSFPHVWFGTSVENQAAFKHRWPLLKALPGAVLFLSIEPLLKPVILSDDFLSTPNVWVIVGGESGPNARECAVEWISTIRNQCAASGVPCFIKQLGANSVTGINRDRIQHKHDKGGDMNEWISSLHVRQFPKAVW